MPEKNVNVAKNILNVRKLEIKRPQVRKRNQNRMKDKPYTAFQTIKKPRTFYGKLGAWASILLNLFLFVIKAVLGFITGSVALIADAFHTLSDLATSFVVLISFYIIAKPSDKKHPFGHGRAEFITAIIMSTLLAITSFEILKQSIERIINPIIIKVSWWVIAVVFLTILFKEGLALYSMRLSKKINSDTLKADAWHHRLDAISSLLVVLSFIFSYYGFSYLDGPVGILITLIIFYSAFKIAKSPIDHLLGMSPSEDVLRKIEEITLSFREVKGVHDVIIHNYGEIMILSLHIEIDENLKFVEAHRIADNVDKSLRRELGAHVTIHFDPVMERTPGYKEVEKVLRKFCTRHPGCDSFHDLRIYGKRKNLQLILDLVSTQDSEQKSKQKLIEDCRNFILDNIEGVKEVTIKVEPIFSISRKSRHN
jgi:cation diffusion facilitator family transporter